MIRYLLLAAAILFSGITHAQIQLLENKGQYPEQFEFVGNLPGGRVFIEPTQLRYEFTDFDYNHHHSGDESHLMNHSEGPEYVSGHAYFMRFLKPNPQVQVIGSPKDNSPLHHYFVGSKDKWAVGVKDHDAINFSNLYHDIDFKYYEYGSTVKYDFIVHPNGNVSDIKWQVDGANELYLDIAGNLNIVTDVGVIQETRPIAYQLINGSRVMVLCQFRREGDILSIEMLSDYDECLDLVIDPTLIFSTYSGSTADNWGNTATFDEKGNLYSGGITSHYNGGSFPTTSGAFQTTTAGFWDVAITKYDSAGTTALYSTYLGGNQTEIPQSLIVNENEELFVLGVTGSSNYPMVNAFQQSFRGGPPIFPFGEGDNNLLFPNGSDLFITRFNINGTGLIGSTYLGGSGNDGLSDQSGLLVRNYGDQSRGDIFIRPNGNVAFVSQTSSSDFPTLNAFQENLAGNGDAIVVELTPDLSNLSFSSYLGGSNIDAAYSIKEGNTGNIVIGGGTASSDIIAFNSSFSDANNGGIEGWLAIIDGTTYQLDTGLFIGTGTYDQVYFLDLDSDNNIYTYGQTSGDFPIVGNVFTSGRGQFVQKWSSDLSALIASMVFGSSSSSTPDISPTAFLVNDCDNIYLSGWGGDTNDGYNGGSTSNMPISSDAYQSVTSGSDFYLMTLSSDLSNFLYGTYLGGTQSKTHVDGGTSRFDKKGIVYHAVCAGCASRNTSGGPTSDFPSTANAWSTTNNSQNCNNAAFKFDLASLRARIQTNTISLQTPGIQTICFPELIVFQNLSIGGSEFIWDFGDGTTLTVADTTFIPHQYERPGVYNVRLTALDPNTCIGTDRTQTVVRVASPTITTKEDTEICEGSPIQLWSIGGVSYNWVSQDSSFQSMERTPVVSPEVSTTYFVEVRDNFGCGLIDTVNIDVVERVETNFHLERVDDCYSRTKFLLQNNSDDADGYEWVLGDGNTSTERELVYDFEQDGEYELRFKASKDFCVFEEVIDLDVVTIRVPNVFTPNNDDANQTFIIEAGGNKVDLGLYNRWGRQVYENSDYQNEWQAEGQPSGIYYYEAIIENQTTCRGWVQVLK